MQRKRRCVFDNEVLVALYRQRGAWNHKTGHQWEKIALFCEKCRDVTLLEEEGTCT